MAYENISALVSIEEKSKYVEFLEDERTKLEDRVHHLETALAGERKAIVKALRVQTRRIVNAHDRLPIEKPFFFGQTNPTSNLTGFQNNKSEDNHSDKRTAG